MKLLCTIGLVALLATGCASALKNNTPTTAVTDAPRQFNTVSTVYEYIVLSDGTVYASPQRASAKASQFSSPVISSVHINSDYR